MKRTFKISVLLIALGSIYTSCKPDDSLPCNGVAQETYIDASGEDSVFVPFFKQDTLRYRRTSVNIAQIDTLVLVRRSGSEDYRLLFTNATADCPEVFWGGVYLFKYVDTGFKDSLKIAVRFDRTASNEAVDMETSEVVLSNYRLFNRFVFDNPNIEPFPRAYELTVLGRHYDNVVGYYGGGRFLNFQINLGIISISDGITKLELLP